MNLLKKHNTQLEPLVIFIRKENCWSKEQICQGLTVHKPFKVGPSFSLPLVHSTPSYSKDVNNRACEEEKSQHESYALVTRQNGRVK